jgi:hypothetical protein
MANNCDTHLISVPNGHVCPKCFPGKEKIEYHLQMIRKRIEHAILDGVSKEEIIELVQSIN